MVVQIEPGSPVRPFHLIALIACSASLLACEESKRPSQEQSIDPARLQPGPIRHEQLTSTQVERIKRLQQTFSEVLAPLRNRYFLSGEINSTVKDTEAVFPRIEERYRDARILKMDGINVDYDDWHFNVRASNTEPLVRLNLEAYTRAAMERRRDEVLALIRQ